MTRRKEFTRTTKLAAWDAAKGKCALCRCEIFAGTGPEYDHRITDEQGGDNSLENCQVLCRPCHRAKTRDDIRVTVKSRSVRAKHVGASKPARPMPGGRGHHLRKPLHGNAIRREPR